VNVSTAGPWAGAATDAAAQSAICRRFLTVDSLESMVSAVEATGTGLRAGCAEAILSPFTPDEAVE
jgi:hypothetical protein